MPRSKATIAYAYLLPSVVVLGAVVLYPVLFGVYASLHHWNWALGQAENMRWAGLGNYVTLLRDSYFWHSVGVTLYFTLVAVVVEFLLGFAIALLLAQDLKGAWFFRAATVFPLMVSDIVAALLWGVILNPSLGILNFGLGALRLPTPDWVGNPALVVPTLALVDAWWQTGNIVLILLAGLSSIPKDRFEMASIDGAHGWKMLRHITIPSLMPFILVALVFRTIDCLRVFALAWGITSGGPLRASEFSQLFIYTQGFGRLFNMGYAAAASVVFALIVGAVVIFYVGPMQRRLSA